MVKKMFGRALVVSLAVAAFVPAGGVSAAELTSRPPRPCQPTSGERAGGCVGGAADAVKFERRREQCLDSYMRTVDRFERPGRLLDDAVGRGFPVEDAAPFADRIDEALTVIFDGAVSVEDVAVGDKDALKELCPADRYVKEQLGRSPSAVAAKIRHDLRRAFAAWETAQGTADRSG
jgi:hypothetical protein